MNAFKFSSRVLKRNHGDASDLFFHLVVAIVCLAYVLFILAMIFYDILYMIQGGEEGIHPIWKVLNQREIQHSILLSLITCTLSAFFATAVAIPMGYVLGKKSFFGRRILDAIVDIPIILPPLVIGLSLLILFQFAPFTTPLGEILPLTGAIAATSLNEWVVYQVPAIVLAQFTVAAAFAIRCMKSTFEQIDDRREQVALTLGCTKFQAFTKVVLPETIPGMITAWTLAWARSLGEFGPLLIFAGATRNKTEVLSTTVFLELSIGNLEAAVAVSLLMIAFAVTVLTLARLFGKSGLI